MLCNLIIDGNYILSRLVFTLHKNNLLFGALEQSLENSINNYRKWYPFKKIYLVSDSKEKSWRKNLTKNYKSNRKKDSDIDWGFVYETYGHFKESTNSSITVLESPNVEGDDWISYICHVSNKDGVSNIIISNDYDIKQLLRYSLDPLCINIMSNEMYNKTKLFMPENYKLFLNKVNSLPNDDIFNLNDNKDFLLLIDSFLNRYDINEVNYIESLVVKLISGDKSDNISSIWTQPNGRGIGEKGAQNIYKKYLNEFGDVDLKDEDLYENIADLVCESKKLSRSKMNKIVSNIKHNSKLIDLRINNIPKDIRDKMSEVYNNSI